MESVGEPETWVSSLDSKAMDAVFQLCRRDDWKGVLTLIEREPSIATTPMIMDNNITTTCLHQAITSKGNIQDRAAVIRRILQLAPQAAQIKNGYGSLPLHVIAQRNTKMKSETKEELIVDLVRAYPDALVEEGGVGKRTPLHIIFTDYVSPRLTQLMVDQGANACFMKDKKGYLPAHVAASRHCSPEKLRMLLAVNPDSLWDTTADGDTLMSLATSTATKSHPNYALIDELQRQHGIMATALRTHPVPNEASGATPASATARLPPYVYHRTRYYSPPERPDVPQGSPMTMTTTTTAAASGSEPSLSSSGSSPASRDRLDSSDSRRSFAGWPSPPRSPHHQMPYPPGRALPGPVGDEPTAPRKKRKSRHDGAQTDPVGGPPHGPVVGHPRGVLGRHPYAPPPPGPSVDDPVGLLLHFSQAATGTTPSKAGGGGEGIASPRRPPMRSRNGRVWGAGSDHGDGGGYVLYKDYPGDGGDDEGSSSPMNFAQV